MKADAYLYASGGSEEEKSVGHYSFEMDMLSKIDRFGLEAITGRRQFYFGELNRMICAENIITAYRSSQRAANWAEWAKSNPVLANILTEAMNLCQL